jgi:hypothetical protein
MGDFRPRRFDRFVTGIIRPSLKNGNLQRQRKNPDRLSANDRASWFFSLPCISPFFQRPASFEFFEQSVGPLEAQVSTKSAALCKGLEPGMCEL